MLLSDLAPPPFVGQGAPIPVIDGLATSVTLGPHKMASIVVATSEMLAASNAERIVGNALTRAVALSIDNVLFDAQPADAVRPAGLRHGIAVIAASSNPYVREAMVADLAVLANEVAPIGGPITYIAAPGRAATINLWATRELPYAVLASPALAATDLICVATDGLASAVSGVPSIDASKYATLALNDPGVVVLSAPTMSMFQADTVGIRVRFDISWGLRSAKALA